MTNKYIYITLLALLGVNAEAIAQTSPRKDAPRLVISIAIDQLRSDYLEAFAPLYTEGGFKRLLSQGHVYVNGTYPFAPIDRASAVAALSTGVTPYYNSIVGARWLNRETLRPIGCVDDAKNPGLFTDETASPLGISTSTIADELKVATNGGGLVYSIAPFRDAAVLAGGHAADGVFWIDDSYGQWCSSQYYFPTLPQWVYAYNGLRAPNMKIENSTWEPANVMVGSFDYFVQTTEQSKPFKHKFTGQRRFGEYKTSGLVNADVTDLATHCIANTGMGGDRVTDLLCLTYYAGSFNHQALTNCQMELLDTYVRLDRELERLINWRLYRESSKGLMTELACHQLQVGTWALGKLPVSVMATGAITHWRDGREVYDNIHCIYEFDDGRQMTYASVISNQFYGLEEQILGNLGTVEPERGKYYYENYGPAPAPAFVQMLMEWEDSLFGANTFAGSSWDPEVARNNPGEWILGHAPESDGTSLLLEAFVEAAITRQQPPRIIEEGYYATQLCLIGHQAIEEHRPVAFPDAMRIGYAPYDTTATTTDNPTIAAL